MRDQGSMRYRFWRMRLRLYLWYNKVTNCGITGHKWKCTKRWVGKHITPLGYLETYVCRKCGKELFTPEERSCEISQRRSEKGHGKHHE